jgi:hypothetical protein
VAGTLAGKLEAAVHFAPNGNEPVPVVVVKSFPAPVGQDFPEFDPTFKEFVSAK